MIPFIKLIIELFLVLFIFLAWKTAIWVALGIPIAFLATFGVMYFSGQSINMISLSYVRRNWATHVRSFGLLCALAKLRAGTLDKKKDYDLINAQASTGAWSQSKVPQARLY